MGFNHQQFGRITTCAYSTANGDPQLIGMLDKGIGSTANFFSGEQAGVSER
jgi:hypothetical protein